MNEMLEKFVSTSERALIIGNVKTKEIFYCNEQMNTTYHIHKDTSDFMAIFQEENRVLKRLLIKQMKEKKSAFFYNIMTKIPNGGLQLVDLQIGYLDREQSVMFMEITPRDDTRMEIALAQVNQSTRAEGILNYDEKLSLLHCNQHFHAVFESNDEVRYSHYGNDFSNGFQPDIREKLLAEIHENLKISPTYFTKLKVITSKGVELWYSLELERRTLDSTGEYIMAYLVNIENLVEIEKENRLINRHFDVIQQLSDDVLFRIDIPSKTLFRGSHSDDGFNLPLIVPNFPATLLANEIVHPDDIEPFQTFVDLSLKGKGGSVELRMKVISEDQYQHRRLVWLPIVVNEGSISEIYGRIVNIHGVKEMETALDSANQYFVALQDLSEDLIFFVNVDEQTLIRRYDQLTEFGLEEEIVNFPQSVCDCGLVHEDDIPLYLEFGHKALAGVGGVAEIRMKSSGSDTFEYRRIIWTPVVTTDGTVHEVFGKLVNIHTLKQLEEQANYDALTHILNKRAMLEMTTEILTKSAPNTKHALFFMDLDDFKYVNDHLGHAFGDYLLSELGSRLRNNIRTRDLVGRVGGDEFVVFLRDVPSDDSLIGKAKMILSTISEDFNDGKQRHNIHGSIGVSIYPDHGTTYEELYHHADLALYRSKHMGKNLVTLYHEDMKD
ncbi:MAG: GGDEF domain-containing protein [Eubacteriales bacterium]